MHTGRISIEGGPQSFPKPEKTFRVEDEDYRGSPVFTIWETDRDGNRVGTHPVIQLGKFKARVILQHVDQLREWVNKKRTSGIFGRR